MEFKETNKCIDDDYISRHPEKFYLDKYGKRYPYFGRDIAYYVNPFKPDTFLWMLEEMDYPFLEKEWLNIIEKLLRKGSSLHVVFGQYIHKIRLKQYKDMTFKDSIYTKDVTEYYIKDINWEYKYGTNS